jgi:hypothetical protein
VACATRSAAIDLIEYAEAEAAGLIRENIDVALALVDALVAAGTLDGSAVDMIIGTAMAKRLADVEMRRRQDWRERTESARTFLPALRLVIDPDDKAITAPQLDIMTIDIALGLLDGLLIVSAMVPFDFRCAC